MPETVNRVVAEYVADTKGLQQGTAVATGSLKQLDKVAEQTTKGLKLSASDAGRGVQLLARQIKVANPVVGTLIDQFAMINSVQLKILGGLEKVGAGLINWIKTPMGLVVTVAIALGGALAGLIYYLGRTEDAARRTKEELEALKKASDEYKKALNKSIVVSMLFGDAAAGIQIDLQATAKQIEVLVEDFAKLTGYALPEAIEQLKKFYSANLDLQKAQLLPGRGKGMFPGGKESLEAAAEIVELIKRYEALQVLLLYEQKAVVDKTKKNVSDPIKRDVIPSIHLLSAEAEAALKDALSYAAQMDIASILGSQLDQATTAFQQWGAELQFTMADVYHGIMSMGDTIASGFGNTLAQIIVYQQNAGQAMLALGKQIAASFIAMLGQLIIQQLLYWVLGKALLTAETSAKLAAQIAIGSAAAAASVFASIPYPANIAMAPFAAGAAAAIIAAAATTGAQMGGALGASVVTPYAQGGLVTSPTLALLGEAGPEIVVPLGGMNNRREANMVLLLEIDGRPFARAVVPYLPGEVRRLGVKGL